MISSFDKWLKTKGGKLKNYYYGTMVVIFGILALISSGAMYSSLFVSSAGGFVISLALAIAFTINLFENFKNIN